MKNEGQKMPSLSKGDKFTCRLISSLFFICIIHRAAFLVQSKNTAGEIRDFNHPIFQVSEGRLRTEIVRAD